MGSEMCIRDRCQFYKGDADWGAVRDVVRSVEKPVFVNGDIDNSSDAITVIEHSRSDGVMVGRSLMGRPWDILEIASRVDKIGYSGLDTDQKAEIAVSHYKDILAFYPEKKAIRFARKHLAAYCDEAGLTKDSELRARICQSLDAEDVARALREAIQTQKVAA